MTKIALLSLTTLLVSCGGGGGGGDSSGGGSTPAPTVTLTAAPTSVGTGGTTTLTWSSTRAQTCTASGGWTGTKAVTGSEVTAALNADATFTLSCTGAGGTTQTNTAVTVTGAAPTPTVQLSANPSTLASGGGASTLTWSSTNATTCTATGGWSGSKALTGTENANLTLTTTFTLSCSGTGGTALSNTTVTVDVATTPPTVQLSATPSTLNTGGGNTTLTWSSTNAATCTGSGTGFAGTRATSGTLSVAVAATTTFSLSCTGAGGTAQSNFTVSVAAAGSTFPLHVDAGKRYLIDAQNRPFLITGDAPWSLIAGLSDADAETYLETRRQQGFNAVLVNLIEHKFSANPPRDAAGDAPFTTAGDFSTPNEAYFAHAETIINKAKQKGMLVLLAPAYMGYQGGDEGWYSEMSSSTNTANNYAKLRGYGQYVATRFAAYDNILWVQGGDYDPPNKELARAVANGIRLVDTAGKWLQTFHGGRGTDALEFLNTTSDPWLTVNDIYTTVDTVVDEARGQYSGSTMPFFLIEAGYEGNDTDGAGVRAQAYQAVLSGASGQVMGNFPVWYFGSGWQGALTSNAGATLGYLPALFSTSGIAWQNLVPDSNGTVLTSAAGSGIGRAVASRASDGSVVVAFAPGAQTLTIDMTKLSGPNVNARWYNTNTGAFSTVSGSPSGSPPFANTGSRSFTAPNGAGNVLVLQSQN